MRADEQIRELRYGQDNATATRSDFRCGEDDRTANRFEIRYGEDATTSRSHLRCGKDDDKLSCLLCFLRVKYVWTLHAGTSSGSA
ncbi:unnamed protein product [Brassica rapa]|uniref:Uncharacterized protein n=1 Tax=Brassica campestris TaxID=3711 RepID=A0A8D9GZG8_BRACM|nr:unnamed protein product [Brassica rapa]